MSNATVTTPNMELTPMRVTYKGVDLGGTLGNVKVKVKYGLADIKADQLGETILDRRTSSLEISIETELTEVLKKDNWKVVFPHAALVTSGPNKQIYFYNNVGDSQYASAGLLNLHPLSKADGDLSEDYNFGKAVCSAESELVYGPKEQVRLKAVWTIYPDTGVVPASFGTFGDPSIGRIAAVAGSPVLTGTGNGTMGSISVFSGVTKTETITATCIHTSTGPTAAIFEVVGSLSGALGNARTGVGFVSPVIAFTIAEGGTAFVAGDAFTISTTAANYF